MPLFVQMRGQPIGIKSPSFNRSMIVLVVNQLFTDYHLFNQYRPVMPIHQCHPLNNHTKLVSQLHCMYVCSEPTNMLVNQSINQSVCQ